jgi:LmbE family N-acetylglucosaminyl deacetylase
VQLPGASLVTTGPGRSGGLLLVHAHPDDECMSTGGIIARALAEGRRVDLVTCTGGEEGEIHDPDLDEAEAKPRLREIRRSELQCSVDALREAARDGGELHLHLLGYRDSGMMGTPSNDRDDVFWRADLEEAIGKAVAIVREARPAVMVSYDSNGGYGHPDHINTHRVAVGAFEAAADDHRFHEAGEPHTVAKLYETAFNREALLGLMLELRSRGLDLPWDFGDTLEKAEAAAAQYGYDALNPTNVEALRQVADSLASGEEPGTFGTPDAQVTTRVDVAPWIGVKHRSMDCHRTQRQDFGWLLAMPEDLVDRALATEDFVLARWRGHDGALAEREDSLFSGL